MSANPGYAILPQLLARSSLASDLFPMGQGYYLAQLHQVNCVPWKLYKAVASLPNSCSAVEDPCTHSVQALLPKTHSSPVPTCQYRATGQSSLGISCLLPDIIAVHTAGPGPLLLWGADLSHVTWDSASNQPPSPFTHRWTLRP